MTSGNISVTHGVSNDKSFMTWSGCNVSDENGSQIWSLFMAEESIPIIHLKFARILYVSVCIFLSVDSDRQYPLVSRWWQL